jgi:hypothetical protein
MTAVIGVVGNKRMHSLNRVAQTIVVLGLIGIPAMLAAWNGDGQEVTRHTIEGLTEVRLGALISFLYVVLVREPKRRTKQTQPSESSHASTLGAPE